jgi:hypothetical protein
MRLHEIDYSPREIIPSELSDELDKEIDELAMFIERHCKPWLKQSGKELLYRGAKVKTLAPAFVKPVRKDRKPKDSSQGQQEFINKMIGMFGGKANRSNSAFVTGSWYTAKEYGHPFVVIPVGNFHYTWSKKVHDFYDYDWGDYLDLNALKAKFKPAYDQLMATYRVRYKKTDAQILKMYKYDIDAEFRFYMRMKINNAPDNVRWNPEIYDTKRMKKDQLFICDKGLESAIRWEHEIMLACDQLLYIDNNFFNRHLRHYKPSDPDDYDDYDDEF